MPFHVLLTDSREKAWAFYKSVMKLTMSSRGAAFSGRVTSLSIPRWEADGFHEQWVVILYLISSRRETYDLILECVPEGSVFTEYESAGV